MPRVAQEGPNNQRGVDGRGKASASAAYAGEAER
jgi:hypothetical protein